MKEFNFMFQWHCLQEISVGESKPNFDIFIDPIMNELKKLEYGIKVKVDNEERDVKFFTIAGIFDKPARAAVLNIINSTGFTSCLKCLEEGESVDTIRGKVSLI